MRRVLIAAVAVAVALGAGSTWLDGRHWAVDLTANRSLSLSAQTIEVVAAVDERVRITAVARRAGPGRAEAAALLARYRDRNRHIRVRVIDPDESRGETQRLGIDPVLGGVAVERGERIERGPTAAEQDVTSALARALRARSPDVCLTTGHGEPDPTATTDTGLSTAARILGDNGYRVRAVDLLVDPGTDLGPCDAVVVVHPTAALGPAAVTIRRRLDADGRLLVLADPSSPVDLTELVAGMGLGFDRGLVFEGDPARRIGADPLTPAVSSFTGGSPVTRNLAPVVFPGVQRVTVAGTVPGLAAAGAAATSEVSYLERQPATPAFDQGTDVQGPVTVLAFADRSRNDGGTVHRSRVVAVGDADFVTNGFVTAGGHSRLLVQALDWLTLDEDLVSVSANVPRLRPLAFRGDRVRAATVLGVVVVPGLFLLLGIVAWAVRRPL